MLAPLMEGLAVWVARFAQASPDAGISDALIERGLLGIFALVAGLLIWRFIADLNSRQTRLLDDQRSDLLAVRAQRDAMVKDVVELVIPAVSRATQVLERRSPVDDRIVVLLDRLERRLGDAGGT